MVQTDSQYRNPKYPIVRYFGPFGYSAVLQEISYFIQARTHSAAGQCTSMDVTKRQHKGLISHVLDIIPIAQILWLKDVERT